MKRRRRPGLYRETVDDFKRDVVRIAVRVTGDTKQAAKVLDIFRSMVPANDLEFRYGINAPTVRIEGLTVGGR